MENLWREFYLRDEEFLDWLNETCTVLARYTDTVTYSNILQYDGSFLSKAPRYIRQVIKLDQISYDEALIRAEAVKSAFLAAVSTRKQTPRLPDRFPIFIDDTATQINIIVNEAYKSIRILRDHGCITVFRCAVKDEKLALDMLSKIEVVYPSAKIICVPGGITVSIVINCNDLLDRFNAESLTLREFTGSQYRAKIAYNNRPSEREKFGNIIVCSDVDIYKTIPQQKRHDAYKPEQRLDAPYLIYDVYHTK